MYRTTTDSNMEEDTSTSTLDDHKGKEVCEQLELEDVQRKLFMYVHIFVYLPLQCKLGCLGVEEESIEKCEGKRIDKYHV